MRRLLRPTHPGAHAPQQVKPPQQEARTPQQKVAPTCGKWRKPMSSNEDPVQAKILKSKINK